MKLQQIKILANDYLNGNRKMPDGVVLNDNAKKVLKEFVVDIHYWEGSGVGIHYKDGLPGSNFNFV